jgi:hypothetical protein
MPKSRNQISLEREALESDSLVDELDMVLLKE